MELEIDCDELAEMDESQLRRLLHELSGDEEYLESEDIDRQELLDIIVAEYATDCYDQLHSEASELDLDELDDDDYDDPVDLDDERYE